MDYKFGNKLGYKMILDDIKNLLSTLLYTNITKKIDNKIQLQQ